MIWPEANVGSRSWAARARRRADLEVVGETGLPGRLDEQLRRGVASGLDPPEGHLQDVDPTPVPGATRRRRPGAAGPPGARTSGVRSRTTSPWTGGGRGWPRTAARLVPLGSAPCARGWTSASEPMSPARTSTPRGSPKATNSRGRPSHRRPHPARRSPTRSWRRSDGVIGPTCPPHAGVVDQSAGVDAGQDQLPQVLEVPLADPPTAAGAQAPSIGSPRTCSSRCSTSGPVQGPDVDTVTETRSSTPPGPSPARARQCARWPRRRPSGTTPAGGTGGPRRRPATGRRRPAAGDACRRCAA